MKKFQGVRGFILGVLVASLVLTFAVPAIAAALEVVTNSFDIIINEEKVAVKGEDYTLANGDSVPNSIVYNGTTYLPLRKVASILGKRVNFGATTGTVYLSDPINPDDYPVDILILEGTDNFRDIGGYETTDGKTVNKGVFLRSAKLTGLTDEDIAKINNAYDIDVDLDFRNDEEVAEDPDPALGDAKYINHSIGIDMSLSFDEFYKDALERSKEDFKVIFQILADPENGTVLFHCTSGRDRTGMVAMILLGLAGVDIDTIVYDYELTRHVSPDTFVRFHEALGTGDLEYTKEFLETGYTMRDAYDMLNEKYGSIEGYLKDIGITDEEIANLMDKLVG